MTIKTRKRKLSVYDLIALISMVGLTGWIATDFFGGMFIWAISYGIIIIPIILLYIFSFIDTIFSLLRKGKKTSKIKLSAHGIVLFTILAFNLYHSEAFKSDKFMSAILNDDLSHYQLILRKNGSVEGQVDGMFGYSEVFHGKYKIENDLIIFSENPYGNNFIPDTLLIDKEQEALFMKKDSNGKFQTEKKWLNHFEIIDVK